MRYEPLSRPRRLAARCRRFLAAALLVCAGNPAPAAAAPAAGVDLRRYASDHYAVRTTLRRSEAMRLAEHMDLVHAEYARRFEGFRPRGAEGMTLYLFRTPDEYIQFMGTMKLPAKNTAGIFFVHAHGRGVATWADGRSRDETLTVLQHEGFHQFAYRYLGDELPVWVNEGLAQYFEDGILLRGEMVLGMANARRIAVVKEAVSARRDVDFDELLNMTPEHWKRTVTAGRGKSTLLYAQSWAMVHFLVHGSAGRYRDAFDAYLAQIGKGRTSHAAFAHAFGTNDTGKFRDRWRQYMRTLEPDPLSTALTRMTFLGEGLRYFAGQGEPAPTNLEELQRRLQRIKFRTVFTQHGFRATTRATDPSVYAYTAANGTEDRFQLLEAVRSDLPPRLAAPGLKPAPTVTWSRDESGELVQSFQFR